MQFLIKILILNVILVSSIFAQEITREQKLKNLEELNSQVKILEKNLLAPDSADLKQAQKDFGVFRLMPREKFDRKLSIQGGGSFYSFKTLSHDYQKTPQLSLERNNLKVGFAGADYGFIFDLDKIPLANIGIENPAVNSLINYRPPSYEPEIRAEQNQAANYDINGFIYKNSLPAVVGHTYILRSINFSAADIFVAFTIHRKDSDGSLIIFWKIIENFPVPTINRREQNSSAIVETVSTVPIPDPLATSQVQEVLWQKGFINVTVEATTTEVILRGSVPKGKMAETVMHAQEVGKRKVVNQLTEQ